MNRAEQLFLPVYMFLTFIAYLNFLLHVSPGIAAGVLLGRFSGAWIFRRPASGRVLLAAVLWDVAALALSVFLGCWNGWWFLYVRKGTIWGGCLAAAGFLAGWLWLHLKQKRED